MSANNLSSVNYYLSSVNTVKTTLENQQILMAAQLKSNIREEKLSGMSSQLLMNELANNNRNAKKTNSYDKQKPAKKARAKLEPNNNSNHAVSLAASFSAATLATSTPLRVGNLTSVLNDSQPIDNMPPSDVRQLHPGAISINSVSRRSKKGVIHSDAFNNESGVGFSLLGYLSKSKAQVSKKRSKTSTNTTSNGDLTLTPHAKLHRLSMSVQSAEKISKITNNFAPALNGNLTNSHVVDVLKTNRTNGTINGDATVLQRAGVGKNNNNLAKKRRSSENNRTKNKFVQKSRSVVKHLRLASAKKQSPVAASSRHSITVATDMCDGSGREQMQRVQLDPLSMYTQQLAALHREDDVDSSSESESGDEVMCLAACAQSWPLTVDSDSSDDDSGDVRSIRNSRLAGLQVRLACQQTLLDRCHATCVAMETEREKTTASAHALSSLAGAPLRFPSRTSNSRRRCLFKDDWSVACTQVALPFTNHCVKHITYNVDQQLFEYCTARTVSGAQCCVPVFDPLHEHALCVNHKDTHVQGQGLNGGVSARANQLKKTARRANRRKRKYKRRSVAAKTVSMDTATSLPDQQTVTSDVFGCESDEHSDTDDRDNFDPDLSLAMEKEGHKLLDDHDLDVLDRLPDSFHLLYGNNGSFLSAHEEADALASIFAEVPDSSFMEMQTVSSDGVTSVDFCDDLLPGDGDMSDTVGDVLRDSELSQLASDCLTPSDMRQLYTVLSPAVIDSVLRTDSQSSLATGTLTSTVQSSHLPINGVRSIISSVEGGAKVYSSLAEQCTSRQPMSEAALSDLPQVQSTLGHGLSYSLTDNSLLVTGAMKPHTDSSMHETIGPNLSEMLAEVDGGLGVNKEGDTMRATLLL